jgi:cell division protein FtsW
MSFETERRTLPVDPMLFGALLGLVVLGAIMVGSTSVSIAARDTGTPLYFFIWHLAALGIGLAALGIAVCVPTVLWYRMNALLLLAGIALLVMVLLPGLGSTSNGSTRWIVLGPVRFQASEPARLCLLMYLASYAVRHNRALATTFTSFLKPLLIVGIVGVLLLAEPDFGALVVITATSLGILFVGGSRLRDFLLAAVATTGILSALVMTSNYRWERILSYLDPFADPFDSGFQLVNSLIAIGRGNWLGVGLGESVQKLFYLPEAHTDFVFAVLAEELGFVGSTLVITLFGLLVFRTILTGRRALAAGLAFQGLLCMGIGLMIGFEAFINIGVNTGLLPTKGLTLPLMSYGRSSVITTLFAIGLVLRVHREVATDIGPRPARRPT